MTKLDKAKEIISNLLIKMPECNGIWYDKAMCFLNNCGGCPDCEGIK